MDIPATMTTKGQLTLPKAVRDALGLREGDRVLFRVYKGKAVLSKVPSLLDMAGSVPVPPGKKGASWSEIRASTWRERTAARH